MSQELKTPEWLLQCALDFARTKSHEFDAFATRWLDAHPQPTLEPELVVVPIGIEPFLTEKPSPNTQEMPILDEPAGLGLVLEKKPKRSRKRKVKIKPEEAEPTE